MDTGSDRAIVLYDRDCGFCRSCLALLLVWDRAGRLEPLALQDPQAADLLPGLGEQARMASWHAVADGQARSGGDAFPPVLRRLPGGQPLAALVASAPGPTAAAYRWIAEHRTGLSRFVPRAVKARADRVIATRVARADPTAS
ncbi:MAG TPA: DCC1-like thiol-disulfide oxidoreductase family protein [Solirubrobacteraceae bacterium]|jgi:predicted DCC family thiol-disulfide oxidoreductase YuxK|nr:DCC1-like thiol-disulfide oxidoreductase family protein [Solirubrobacteraceae bacterium]